MREIKYRAILSDEYTIYGSSKVKSQWGVGVGYKNGQTLSLKEFFTAVEAQNAWDKVRIHIGTINNKDIYLGDILLEKFENDPDQSPIISLVIWDANKLQYLFEMSKSKACVDLQQLTDNEVIGNDIQTPELLEEKGLAEEK